VRVRSENDTVLFEFPCRFQLLFERNEVVGMDFGPRINLRDCGKIRGEPLAGVLRSVAVPV
jgi:hypothetical protein